MEATKEKCVICAHDADEELGGEPVCYDCKAFHVDDADQEG